ncbi:putative reverse transcriptase domain-containing protein [Tanacetum coccineum]
MFSTPSVIVATRNTQEENVGQSSIGPTANESGPDVSFAFLSKVKGMLIRPMVSSWESGWLTPSLLTMLGILGNPDVNLMKEDVFNVSVWVKIHGVPVTTFTEYGLSAIATKIGTPLMLDSYTSDMCIQSWGRSSYARAMIEIRADAELKDTIVVAMPKLTGEGFYTCTIRVKYEWKPPKCTCCKVFDHIQEDCPKNLGLGVAKNLKKPILAPRGVPVGSKNVETSSTSTTHIVDKIRKLEKLIIEEKATLVDDDGKPLKKVDYLGDHDSNDEVFLVDNDMAHSMATETVGFGTKSLLEQWTDSYVNGDYDEDPYDDDMYEGQVLLDKL